MSAEAIVDGPLSIGTIATPRQFNQLVITAMDGSGSMAGQAVGGITKAQATNGGIRGLLSRLKVSRKAPNFSFAMVNFSSTPRIRHQPAMLTEVDENADYDPGTSGGTRIDLALEEAERIADGFLSGAKDGEPARTVVILLMSDGECEQPAGARSVAARIKSGHDGRIKIASTLFCTVGQTDQRGEQLLRDIASDPVKLFANVYDAETLRNFLHRSVSVTSGTNL